MLALPSDKIIAKKEQTVGWITFNNPERRNAMSLDMWEAFGCALDDFSRDEAVRVVVMKGAGDKAFVSGADISQFDEKRNNAEAAEQYRRTIDDSRRKLRAFDKPLIAMIRGYCLGGGLSIACEADLRVAGHGSRFGIPAARLGIAYSAENLRRLVDLVGPSRAKDMLFTARRLSADEAFRIGLVDRLVPDDQLEPEARELAALIAANAPLSVRASKLTINEIMKDPHLRVEGLVEELNRACFDSEDYAEGRRAFSEKRDPVFHGQ